MAVSLGGVIVLKTKWNVHMAKGWDQVVLISFITILIQAWSIHWFDITAWPGTQGSCLGHPIHYVTARACFFMYRLYYDGPSTHCLSISQTGAPHNQPRVIVEKPRSREIIELIKKRRISIPWEILIFQNRFPPCIRMKNQTIKGFCGMKRSK